MVLRHDQRHRGAASGADGWAVGAARTQPAAVEKLLRVLAEILDSQAPPPSIVPTHEGGVQAEWHCNGVDLEIEVTPAGAIEYYFRSPLEEHEDRVVGDLSALARHAQAVHAQERSPRESVRMESGDDPGISDDGIVLRRVHEGFVVLDDNVHRKRLSTQAFKQGGADGLVSV